MSRKTNIKELYLELTVACCVLVVAAVFFISTDFFEWWFEYTRAHENWELDEVFSVIFAALIAGTAIAVRHVFVMRRFLQEIEEANHRLERHEEERVRGEKMVALGNLAGGLAHELNNALQPVIGLGGFILKGLKDSGNEKHADYMRTIISSSEHAQGIIENVLLFAHEKSLDFESMDAKSIVSDALEFCTSILPSGVSVDIRDDLSVEDEISIQANRTGFYQIFYNLLKNASIAMDEQGAMKVMVSSTAMPEQREVRAVRVDISDEGCGMDGDVLRKIFDPFFSTRDISEGTGLGLPTVYALVEQHGGYILVDSVVDEGTTFSLFFPVLLKEKG